MAVLFGGTGTDSLATMRYNTFSNNRENNTNQHFAVDCKHTNMPDQLVIKYRTHFRLPEGLEEIGCGDCHSSEVGMDHIQHCMVVHIF